jgi:hypothetical protein
MTTTNNSKSKRSIVALNLPTRAPALISYAAGILKAMTGNAAIPNPVPSLTTVASTLAALQAAETAALARTKGAVATRNEIRAQLEQELLQLKGTVQAASDASPENGVSIIQSSGMGVRKPVTHAPRAFSAVAGAVSGSAKLYTSSAGRASYDWQSSADGGKTWTSLSSTLQAKTTVTGLTPGSSVMFRSRALTRTGEGDWSQPITFIVK